MNDFPLLSLSSHLKGSESWCLHFVGEMSPTQCIWHVHVADVHLVAPAPSCRERGGGNIRSGQRSILAGVVGLEEGSPVP